MLCRFSERKNRMEKELIFSLRFPRYLQKLVKKGWDITV